MLSDTAITTLPRPLDGGRVYAHASGVEKHNSFKEIARVSNFELRPAAATHTGLLITLTIIAALGGLLFGYDSAVISGATESIKQNFVAPMGLAEGARLSLEGFTIAGALWGCLIGGALGGVMAHFLGRRGGLIVAGVLFFVSSLGSAWPESLAGPSGLGADSADQCPDLVPEPVLRGRSLPQSSAT